MTARNATARYSTVPAVSQSKPLGQGKTEVLARYGEQRPVP